MSPLLALLPLIPPPAALYTKSSKTPDGKIEMSTKVEHLTAPGKPDVWLVGAVHIGTKAYYTKVQSILDAQDCVLYEGVKMKPTDTMAKNQAAAKSQASIYKVFGDAIGLDFQLVDINYDHPNWRDSDLTWSQITELNKRASGGKKTQFDQIQQMLTPNSPTANMFAKMITSSTPGTREAFKILLVKNVASGGGPGLDPTTSGIVVDARNRAVLTSFQHLIKEPAPPKSVAIFYGALHLSGISKSLAVLYGYQPRDEQWITAASADPKKVDSTGRMMLSAMEKMMKPAPKT